MLLAGLARARLQLASEVEESAQELQRRWGELSVQKALFECLQNHPVDRNQVQFDSFELGSMVVDVRIDNESTKINLNHLYKTAGQSHVREVAAWAAEDRFVVLRPNESLTLDAFSSWGEVYDLPRVAKHHDVPLWLRHVTQQTTCWGDGRLDFRLVPDEILDWLAAELSCPPIRKLQEIRKDSSSAERSDVFRQIGAEGDELVRMTEWFADNSTCYTIWISMESAVVKRDSLTVVELRDRGSSRHSMFEW